MSLSYSFEIQCSPGSPRPSEHFISLCNECGLDSSWFYPPSKFFGNWEWAVKPEHVQSYKDKQDLIGDYLTKLYKNGYIQYAAW